MTKPRYTLKPATTPLPSQIAAAAHETGRSAETARPADPFIRPEAEDDDGYDPYSDRPPTPEPTFQENPWD